MHSHIHTRSVPTLSRPGLKHQWVFGDAVWMLNCHQWNSATSPAASPATCSHYTMELFPGWYRTRSNTYSMNLSLLMTLGNHSPRTSDDRETNPRTRESNPRKCSHPCQICSIMKMKKKHAPNHLPLSTSTNLLYGFTCKDMSYSQVWKKLLSFGSDLPLKCATFQRGRLGNLPIWM